MTSQGAKVYQQTNVTTTDPATLILMLYDGAIKNLFRVRDGIRANDPKQRGEHLSKTIAIITELLSSVQGDENNEVANFLRSMYSSMLTELVKVNLDNDPVPVELSIKYLAQMRDIWKKEVMDGEGVSALRQSGNIETGVSQVSCPKKSVNAENTFGDHVVTYGQHGFAATA